MEYYKSLEQDKRKLFAQASHLPLIWENALVPPFRFNPNLKKEKQGEVYFVQVKAKFLPDKDLFAFDSLMGIPTVELPRFIKFKQKRKNKSKKSCKQKTSQNQEGVTKDKPEDKQFTLREKVKKDNENLDSREKVTN